MTNDDQIVFRLPRKIGKQARKAADKASQSLGTWLRDAVKEKLARQEARP